MDSETSEKTPLLKDAEPSEEYEELHGCGATLPCDPRRSLHRYLVLAIMCLLSFGSYFCYDNPAALQDQMKSDLNLSTSQFMGFYSWYSWPNVILCFFGGYLIDKVFGIRLGTILFAGFVTAGQILFALGAYLNHLWLMDAARFVFGVGGESLAVAQNTYAVSWFKGRELNMVFGLQLSLSRVGSTVNMNVMHPLYMAVQKSVQGYKCMGIVLFIAASTCVFSLCLAIAMAFFDRRVARILKREKATTGEVIRIKDVKDFNVSVWFLCVICVAYYVAIFPFIGLGLVFFEMKFDLSPSEANAVNSLVYIISAVASPLFGFIIDKTGKNIFWVMVGTVVTIGCHATLAFTFFNPWVPMIVMGLAYSVLASALWPMVAFIVPEHQLGTAYGIMQSIQNLGLAVIALVVGVIADKHGYLMLEVFFLMCLCVALIFAVILYLYDAAKGGYLNLYSKTRRELDAIRAEEKKNKAINQSEDDKKED